MKITTINVIERVESGHIVTHAFPDTPEGNERAENLFGHIAKENGLEGEQIEEAIESGYTESGTWELYLVHSET